jgi:DNA repair exonuclease SbcCD ATPase subunit
MMVGVSVDDLYGLPREEFIPARRELARQVREAGDKEGAAAIEKLAKPTTAAWLVNRLAREHPDDVESLISLGDELREATGTASGSELRALTRRRTELIGDLVRLAGGSKLTEAIVRELEDMFTAAVATPEAAEVLRAGRITTARDLAIAPTWPGLSLSPPSKPAVKKPAEKSTPRTTKADDERARKAAARQALADAKAQVKAAESERAAADKAIRKAEDAVTAAEKRVRDLNAELDAAELAELDARRTLQMARRDAKEAERAAGLAWRKMQQVEESSGD